MRQVCFVLLAGIVFTAAGTAQAQSDFQITLDNDGNLDYTLTDSSAVSSPLVYDGGFPVNDPTLNLIVGKRYEFTIVNFVPHPLDILAKGASAGDDVVLLSQGIVTGTLEDDPDINFTDDGTGTIAFTVTQALVDAMTQDGLAPGYRCNIHAITMRGDFQVFGAGTRIDDPLPSPIAKGDIVIELEPVTDGLASPLGLVPAGDGTGRMFVYDQAGQVYIINSDGNRLSTPFLDVSDRLVSLNPGYDERGLLGFAVHPDFAGNGFVYTYTSEPADFPSDFTVPIPQGETFDHQSVIAEWQISGSDPNRINIASRRELMRIDQPQSNHNGGLLVFDDEGRLLIALGDGGSADDQGIGHSEEGNGQDSTNVLGSILAIFPQGSNSDNGQYGIPLSNPFQRNQSIPNETWAFGFRNPFGVSLDSLTNEVWIADVGQNDIEEVNKAVEGGNHGWRYKEGSFFFDPNGSADGFVTTEAVQPLPPNLVDPVAEYDHDEGLSVIGGYVYRGSALPELEGRYVFGDFSNGFASPNGRLFYLGVEDSIQEFQIGTGDRPLGAYLKGFGQDAGGELYVMVSQEAGPSGTSGEVLRIVPAGPAETPTPTPEPSPTPTATPTPTAPPVDVDADLNNDGVVDALDLLLFTQEWHEQQQQTR